MTDSNEPIAPVRRSLPNRAILAIAGAGLFALGGAGGALATSAHHPAVAMAPAAPVAIRSLANDRDAIVTVRGQVAEVFGNRFVMADATGRMLIDTGRAGEDGTLVSAGQVVTVQGRYDRGAMHAAYLVGANGKVTALGPMGRGGPDGDRCGPGGPDGPGGPGGHGRHGRGPDDRGPGGPDDRSPPPAPVTGAATPAPAPAATPANG